ncbi:uncharacterized protein [Aegilops tauschii subsp. strangulata]|uniref:uncharacterized protein n=1 Tax=Aegilops tauschii subsp. strangulata TaxID=200361 RepID=UPI003CC8A310
MSDLPWLCFGDFNEVLRPEEHQGVADRSNAQIQAFRDAVDVCMLMDLGYQGRPWTFEKRVTGGSFCRVRLDRALASASWTARYPLATLYHLDGATSDHGPILLRFDGTYQYAMKEKMFRYETMWQSHEAWRGKITDSWSTLAPVYGVGDFRDKLLRISRDVNMGSRYIWQCEEGDETDKG